MTMELTAQTIRDAQFREGWRGYSQAEVDEFLEQMAVGVDALRAQIRELSTRSDQPVATASASDDSIRRTLVLAQRAADLVVSEAKAVADKLVQDANEKVATIEGAATERASRVVADAQTQAEVVKSDAAVAASALLADANREASELRSRAEADAGSVRSSADGHAEAVTTAATAKAEQMTTEAAAEAQKLRSDAAQGAELVTSEAAAAAQKLTADTARDAEQLAAETARLAAEVTSRAEREAERARQAALDGARGELDAIATLRAEHQAHADALRAHATTTHTALRRLLEDQLRQLEPLAQVADAPVAALSEGNVNSPPPPPPVSAFANSTSAVPSAGLGRNPATGTPVRGGGLHSTHVGSSLPGSSVAGAFVGGSAGAATVSSTIASPVGPVDAAATDPRPDESLDGRQQERAIPRSDSPLDTPSDHDVYEDDDEQEGDGASLLARLRAAVAETTDGPEPADEPTTRLSAYFHLDEPEESPVGS